MKSEINNDFFLAYLAQKKPGHAQSEYLDWIGQPMLYDGELFVIRRILETQHEIYVNIKGIRCV